MAKSAKNDKKLTKIKKTKSVARNRPFLEHSLKVKDSFARAISHARITPHNTYLRDTFRIMATIYLPSN